SVFTGAGTSAFVTTVLAGDTVSSIAQRVGADPQDIALANNVSDPMDLQPGTTMVVPANTALAQILASQSLKQTPSSWKGDQALDPFDQSSASGGDTRYIPSALDEDGPVGLDYATDPSDLATPYASFGSAGGAATGSGSFVLTGKDGDDGRSDSDF